MLTTEVNESVIQRYMIIKHLKIKDYKCHLCGKLFARKTGLASYYDFVHGEKNAKCDFCEKYFKTEENLSKHIIAIHEKCQDFKCHLCGKGFAFQLYLDTHIKNTHGEKKYSCDFYGKSCARAGDLKKHIKCVHEGQTDDYKCDSCGKSLASLQNLKNHIRSCANKVILTNHKTDKNSQI